jgi:alkanesulfonate monooxygenase SsuD/methylene tetrahydromethanopterin reductase-like flavin-dependent oxidoreductase (luciferase family)
MTVEDLRAIPGRVGLWSMELRSAGQAEVRDAASELDGLGFRALWIPGGDGTRVFGDLGRLLQAAPHTAVALGVLGIWGYDPAEVGEHLNALDRAYGPRAILGFGVSSAASAGSTRPFTPFPSPGGSWARSGRRWPPSAPAAPPGCTRSW